MALEACGDIPACLAETVTPLRWQAWEKELENYPDQRFRQYIVGGGFSMVSVWVSCAAINHLADAISRDNLHHLFSQVPESVSAQMPIPPPLLELLLDHSQDWTSESWRSQFVSCFQPAWQSQPRSHIGLAQTGT